MTVIKMEMPKSCEECEYCGADGCCQNYIADCFWDMVDEYTEDRHPQCPLLGGVSVVVLEEGKGEG